MIIPVQSGNAKPPPPPEEAIDDDPQVLSSGAIQIVESGVTDLSDSEMLQMSPPENGSAAKALNTSRDDSDDMKTQLIPYIEEKTDPALKALKVSAVPEPSRAAPAFGRVAEERKGFPIGIVVAIECAGVVETEL